MRLLGAFAAATSSFLATAALACTLAPPAPHQPSSAYLARQLVSAAAAVDVVVLERSERLSSASFARGLFGNGAGQMKYSREAYLGQVALAEEFEPMRLSFKVVESLKGHGASRFSLTGVGPASDSSTQSLAQYANPQEIEAVELTPLNLAPGTCLSFPGALKGVRYLVFRDAKGALVSRAIPWKAYRRGGPSYMAVPRANDAWLVAVRHAVAAERKGR